MSIRAAAALAASVLAIGAAPAATAQAPKAPAKAAAPAAMPAGDATRGQAVFAQCRTCHEVLPGKNKVGPTLHGVVGRKAGTVPGYTYSAANKSSGVTWTQPTLFTYLENPKKFMPGTKMIYAGLKDPQKRADVIAFLATKK